MDSSSSSEEENPISDPDFTSSDDEVGFILGMRMRPKNENYEETVARYNEMEFLEHFRVSKTVFQRIFERYERSAYHLPDFNGPFGRLTPSSRVLIFLWFCGHQTASFRDVADRFDISISTLEDVIKRMSLFLSNLSPSIIKWPTIDEMEEGEREFRRKGFPRVIGAIDGTHIKIDKPAEDPDSYYNRKDIYSVQLQVICDHKRRIIDLFVGFPGSVHDARVFRASPIAETLHEKCEQYLILGDSAYPCLPNLITPYKDRGNLTGRQRRFNYILSRNRCIIEHTFGLLKQKFRQLFHLKLRSIFLIVNFIRACCVLHNLALEDDCPSDSDPLTNSPLGTSGSDNPAGTQYEDSRPGLALRDELCLALNM